MRRFWFQVAPPERLATVRVLVGGFSLAYLLVRFAHLLSYARFDAQQFRPVGPITLLDAPMSAPLLWLATIAAAALALAFTVGWRFRVTGPLFGAALLWVLSYRNSWGMVFHTENLLVLHVIVLGLARSADVWSLDARGRAAAEPHERYGWPLRLMAAVCVATYFLAGLAKLELGGWGWASGEVLRNYVATDALRKVLLGSFSSPLAVPLMQQGWLFAVLAVFTFAIELGAPLALVHRRLGHAWVAGAIAFHWGVLAMMAIAFPYPMSGIGFACFLPAERLVPWLRRRLARLRR